MGRSRLSLTARIFFSSAGIVVLVMAATLVLTQRAADRAAQQSIERALRATQARVHELVAAQRGVTAGALQTYASTPDYRNRLEVEEPDYLDYVEVAVEETGVAWAQFVDRDGLRQAKSDAPTAPVVDVGASKLIQDALNGDVAQSFGVAGDTSLVQYVAVPVNGANNRRLGVLMAAQYVSDSIAVAIGGQTNSDLVFFRLDTLGVPRLVASTADVEVMAGDVLGYLARQFGSDAGGVRLAGAPADSGTALLSDEMVLGGDHFVSAYTMVRSASGAPVGGFVAMRSRDRELRENGFTKVRQTILFAGGGGFLFALLMGFVTSRQVVSPVRQLAEATRRAAEGDYAAEIPEGGSDEIGTLSSAFRRLLADLRDKQALVDFLSAAAPSGRTQIVQQAATTVQIPAGEMKVLSPGQTFGSRYEIRGVLGVGGMGVVYKAHDRELGEVLAIKTLKPELLKDDASALERFKSEIRLARRIAHRNVVRTYDLGEITGQYYISMEYVEGKPLKELIRERGRLPASVVLPIAKQLCRALEVSHDEGVIHRDIKPQNMVVQGDGVLKVMDFGIARLVSRPSESGHTRAGMVVGTPEYMAPEQLMGDELDARADLYATGVVLYECLVGRVPHTADTPITLIARVLEEEPQPPSALQPDIPQALSDLVLWALAKDREKRPRTAMELHERLDLIQLS